MSNYLRSLAFSTVGLTLALAAFNAFMDPYGHFNGPRIKGINDLALGFNHRLPLAKSLAVSRIKPATIILGNSRAETGLDPQHPGFIDQPAYNLAIGGAGLRQIRRYYLEALAAGGVRHVVLSLDLTMFEPIEAPQETFSGPVLLTDDSGSLAGARKWTRLLFILLSSTASSDSWWSLTHQRKSVAIYHSTGLKEASYDNEQVVREGGHRAASIRAESGFLTNNFRDISSENFRAGYKALMAQLREIVTIAAERNIRLTMLINPIHARQNYMLETAGLWAVQEQWKRDLTAVVDQSPRRDLVSIWDFSGISTCTAEKMPATGSAAFTMRWYRESSHFNRALGDLALDQVLGNKSETECPGLGYRLDSSSVDIVLRQQRSALGRWIQKHSEDAAEIDKVARKLGRGPGAI
jgi:hypothetical protein